LNTILFIYFLLLEIQQGEAADGSVRTVDDLSKLLNDFLSAKFHSLFYRIVMHRTMSSDQFKSQTREIIANTRHLCSGSTTKDPSPVSEERKREFMSLIHLLF
jgi:hypothetical protein